MVKIVSILSAALFATLANAATVYTGDILSGHKVISNLDVTDIPANAVTKLWLRMTKDLVGQSYHVPIIVARGPTDGNRLLLNSGLHGDELNGIRVVQRFFADIDVSKLKGVVVGVPGANINGMYEGQRSYVNKYDTGSLTNLNREFPGNITNRAAGKKFAATLWSGIYGNNNFTAGVDYHTQSSTTKFPNFVYADLTIPYVYRMTELTGADIVKVDVGSGTLGALENVLDEFGTPAITYELGNPKLWEKDQIQRGYDYAFRQMTDLNMYPATTDAAKIATYEAQRKKIYYGNEFQSTYSTQGGFVELYVKVLDQVKKDQLAGRLFNVWGDKVEDYYPKFDGIVLSVGNNPLHEPGASIVNTIHNSTDPKCINGC
ncbi:hypothetical protein BB559_000176 [Furculomyces boomerangus]|uniref:Succinylglutamate desuccinylase/Aspartoacylase catalytic domain-containing protein n=2 Tax=Harpellales TaxID=61421 RepID=A0A2T9Z619_9FUNG|nr:hypothetical protein BB559_000176 [Furculomyces boomerangus]PVZ97934.1 hypothetical protein BB558_006097 [Smittium angustum]PWA01815.1 hypothetical protein BB558_002070 [Smittium angustum]